MIATHFARVLLALVLLNGAMPIIAQSGAVVQAQSPVIRITAPQQHQRQTANFVTVRYELQNPTSAPAGSPNFQVQLDGSDPVTTASTSQNFTGLTPENHVVTVRLVDANGTPVPQSQTQVQFAIVPTSQNSASPGTPQAKVVGDTDASLPEAGTLLPVLSVIGFGVLVGGIVSSMKTR